MNYQLRSLIEWAKDLKGFVELSDNDKVINNIINFMRFNILFLDCSFTWSYGRKSHIRCCVSFIKL